MSNVVALQPQRSLRDYSGSQLTLIRKTVAADCNEAEFDLFMEVARRAGLDPFRKQIHAVVYNKNKPDKRKMSIITGIDGFRAIAARTGDYRPADQEPEITYDETLKDPNTNPLGIVKAVVRLYKFGPDRQWHPVVGTAYWSEFAPITEKWAEINGKWQATGEFTLDRKSNWYRMPHVMLPKCATAQACRAGWPDDFSGVYMDTEMDQAAMRDITPSAEILQYEQEQRMARIGASNTVPILWTAGEPIEAVPSSKLADRVLEFIGKAESPVQIETWRDANQLGLNQFWALHKSDALSLKRSIEERIEALAG